MDSKNINSIPEVSPNDTRKILCGEGVITVAKLKEFINSEIPNLKSTIETLQEKVSSNTIDIESCNEEISKLQTSIDTILQRLEGIGMSSMLGFVYEEDSEGELTLIENEIGEWRTVKMSNGTYTQKFVKLESNA